MIDFQKNLKKELLFFFSFGSFFLFFVIFKIFFFWESLGLVFKD